MGLLKNDGYQNGIPSSDRCLVLQRSLFYVLFPLKLFHHYKD